MNVHWELIRVVMMRLVAIQSDDLTVRVILDTLVIESRVLTSMSVQREQTTVMQMLLVQMILVALAVRVIADMRDLEIPVLKFVETVLSLQESSVTMEIH